MRWCCCCLVYTGSWIVYLQYLWCDDTRSDTDNWLAAAFPCYRQYLLVALSSVLLYQCMLYSAYCLYSLRSLLVHYLHFICIVIVYLMKMKTRLILAIFVRVCLSVHLWLRLPHASSGSCRTGPIHFVSGWCKSWPDAVCSFVRFTFAYVCINCCCFLCCHLVVVIFVLLVAAKWLVRKTGFLHQSNDWLGRSSQKINL